MRFPALKILGGKRKMAEHLFYTVLEISVSVSAVILLVFVLTPLLKKRFTAKWRYWIWFVLAVRLLIPVNFHMPQPAVRIPVSQKTVAVQNVAPSASVQKATTPAPTKSAPQASSRQPFTVSRLLAVVWIAGAAVFLLSRFSAYFAFLRGVRRWSRPVREPEMRETLQSQKAELGIRRSPVFLRCKKISSPMMAGFFRPMLLLPEVDYSQEELQLILKHELIHWKHRDVWYKLLLCAANAVHWFNPVVWLMARKAGEDTELVCDSEVIKGFGTDSRRRYGETILSSVRRSRMRGTSFSTYFYGGAKTLKQRFANILDSGKKHRGIAAFCAVLIGITAVGSLVACGETNRNLQVSSGSSQNVPSSVVTSTETSATTQPSSAAEKEALVSSSMTAAYQDVKMAGKTVCGAFGTVICGSLKSNPKQGVAVVIWNNKNSNAKPTRYLTPGKHGAIKADVTDTAKNAKKDVFTVVAEDGYTWLFNLYNGFENGRQGSRANSLPEQGVTINPVNTSGFRKKVIGADPPDLDYASTRKIIFHGYFGLFVYDLQNKKVTRSVDLKAIGCDATQGDNYVEVFVSKDGGTVYLHHVSAKDRDKMFVYSVDDNRMVKTDYRVISNRYVTGDISKINPPDMSGATGLSYGQIAPNVYAYLFYGNSSDAFVGDLQAVVYYEGKHLEKCYNVFK